MTFLNNNHALCIYNHTLPLDAQTSQFYPLTFIQSKNFSKAKIHSKKQKVGNLWEMGLRKNMSELLLLISALVIFFLNMIKESTQFMFIYFNSQLMNPQKNQYSLPKSISPKNRLKVASKRQISNKKSLLSPKMRGFIESGIRPRKKMRSQQKYLIWIPEEEIFVKLKMLGGSLPKNLLFCNNLREKGPLCFEKNQTEKNKLWIITSMDAFTETFLVLRQKLRVQCQQWIIISSAINSKDTQTNFNQAHHPLKFKFIIDFPALCNYLNGFISGKTVRKIQKLIHIKQQPASYIINNSSNPPKVRLSIEEKSPELITKINEREIYIIDDLKKLKNFGERVYFLEGSDQFDDDALIMSYSVDQKCQLVVLNSYVGIQSVKNLDSFERKFMNSKITPFFLHQISQVSHSSYINKLMLYYLFPMKKICVFYQQEPVFETRNTMNVHQVINNLITSDQNNIFYLPEEIFNPSLFQQSQLQFFYLKFGQKTSSPFNFNYSLNKDFSIQSANLRKFLSEIQQLQTLLSQKSSILKKMIVMHYSTGQKHALIEILSSMGIRIEYISQLQQMYESHKITIVVGKLSYNDVNSLKDFHNVFVLPVENKLEENATLRQLQETHQFIKLAQNAYNKFYIAQQQLITQASIHILYAQPSQITQIKSILNFPEKLTKIQQLDIFLKTPKIGPHSKHLIFIQMSQFNETIENTIQDILWNDPQTISIDVYLKYGQQLIFRTKEGGFKFFKKEDIQGKIDQIQEQFASVPAPQIFVPEPLPVSILEEDKQFQDERDVKQEKKFQKTYRLYICIHRSIPHHSFQGRLHKQYLILVYNRIEQILAFHQHTKGNETVLVVCNAKSEQIYTEILKRSSRSQTNPIQFLYCKDLSENKIRKQIDTTLNSMKISSSSNSVISPEKSSYFSPVVLYNSYNEKATKGIKFMKKLFNNQLKVLFIKNAEFQELKYHHAKFQLSGQVRLFKLGNEFREGVENIKSIKQLLSLAMHPQIKAFSHDVSVLKFSTKLMVGKILYDDFPKDYEITTKKNKVTEMALNRIKSHKTIFHNSPQYITHTFSRQKSTPRRPKLGLQTRSSSFLKNTSTIKYRFDSKLSIAVSQKMRQFYKSENVFKNELEMAVEIIKNQSHSKLSVIVLSEEQHEFYSIFEGTNLYDKYAHVVWVVGTSRSYKQIFMNSSLIFVHHGSLSQVIENLRNYYKQWGNFSQLIIENSQKIKQIKHVGIYEKDGQNKQKVLKFKIVTAQQELHTSEPNTLFVRALLNKQSDAKERYNQIFLPTYASINNFLTEFIKIFTQNSRTRPQISIGSMILFPKPTSSSSKAALAHLYDFISKPAQKEKNKIIEYSQNKYETLLQYSILRVLILYHESTALKKRDNFLSQIFAMLNNSVLINSNSSSMVRILQRMLI